MKIIKYLTLSFITTCLFHAGFAQSFKEVLKAVSSDLEGGDQYAFSVAISGDYAIIGAYLEDENATGTDSLNNAGSAYIFERSASDIWSQVQKIVASDREAGDAFGISVAISGNYIIVGANGEDENTSGLDSLTSAGAAYIFERDGLGIWNEVEKIVASDRETSDFFGRSVSVSGDYAIVGAYFEDNNVIGTDSLSKAGSAYIFERDGLGNWSEVQKVVASDRAENDYFGYSVSISGDYAIVGAYLEDEDTLGANTLNSSGSAYIFERSGLGIWNEVQKIVASDRGAVDLFGYTVSISGDYAIVGAYKEDEDTAGNDFWDRGGSAYIFERSAFGSWSQVQKITASDRGGFPSSAFAYFGISVSISGNKAIVAATYERYPTVVENPVVARVRAGAAYIFERLPSGYWKEIQKIVPSDRDNFQEFGNAIAISNDYAIVGAFKAASAYIFHNTCQTKSTQIFASCLSYTAPSGDTTYTQTGTYLDTIPNADGCDSIMTFTVIIKTVDTSVSFDGMTLQSNSDGANYQWLDCNSGNMILLGDTNQSFIPANSGTYAVIVSEANHCIDTSACHTITLTNIEENILSDQLSIYPNPTNGLLFIDFKQKESAQVTIFDIIGKIVFQQAYISNRAIDIGSLTPGSYFIKISSDNKVVASRIITKF